MAHGESSPGGHSGRLGALLALGAALCFVLVSCVSLFSVEVEDAFIFLRCAYNLAAHGELVYNPGDRICVFTSPLYQLVVCLLYFVPVDFVLTTKVFALLCYAATVALLVYEFRHHLVAVAACLTAFAASPFVIHWTFGGLETPLLTLLVTVFCLFGMRAFAPGRAGTGVLIGVFVAIGSISITRYDATAFPFAAAVALLWKRRDGKVLLTMAAGALLPVAWLVFAHSYYGDVFPTSFYVKLEAGLGRVWYNTLYMLDFAVLSGLLPFGGVLAAVLYCSSSRAAIWRGHWRATWWVYAGIAATLAYGLAAATTHMFYAFRLLVPIVPAAALVLADLVRRIDRSEVALRSPSRTVMLIAAVGVLVLQVGSYGQIAGIRGGLAGARNGEFRNTSVPRMNELNETYAAPAPTIAEHWERQDEERIPRIFTWAAGELPYALKEAYYYEPLSAYRHGFPDPYRDPRLKLCADYVCTLTRSGSAAEPSLPAGGDYVRIFTTECWLFNIKWNYEVYFNRSPMPHYLPTTIGGSPSQ